MPVLQSCVCVQISAFSTMLSHGAHTHTTDTWCGLINHHSSQPTHHYHPDVYSILQCMCSPVFPKPPVGPHLLGLPKAVASANGLSKG